MAFLVRKHKFSRRVGSHFLSFSQQSQIKLVGKFFALTLNFYLNFRRLFSSRLAAGCFAWLFLKNILNQMPQC